MRTQIEHIVFGFISIRLKTTFLSTTRQCLCSSLQVDLKAPYASDNRMFLEFGVSATEITHYDSIDDYDDQNDALIPFIDETFGDLETIIDEDIQDDKDNETNVTFNNDISKIAINDILNEMRMCSPIQNDLFNDLLNDEINNNLPQFDNGNLKSLSINPNDCHNNNYNKNNDIDEQEAVGITDASSLLDDLLHNEPFSSPDVQVEFNDGVQFQYDASDQFTCVPDTTLPYIENPDGPGIAIQDSDRLRFEANLKNNYNTDQTNFAPETNCNRDETAANTQYFECSTTLPMTLEELQQDIEQYLSRQENYSLVSFYEYAEMIYNTVNKRGENKRYLPYSSELLQEYITEQDRLFQSLDPISPLSLHASPNEAWPDENKLFKCNRCSFYTDTVHGICVHKRVHSNTEYRCSKCSFVTARAYNLKQHQAYFHGACYSCQYCGYITHSRAKIRRHVRTEH